MKVLTRRKLSILVVGVALWLITFAILLIFGQNYTLKLEGFTDARNVEDVIIEIEPEDDDSTEAPVIEIVDVAIRNNAIYIGIKPLAQGQAFINVKVDDEERLERVFVHCFGIITRGDFFGDTSGDFIIPLCTTIFLAYVLVIAIKTYRESIKKNLYQYKNITRLGLIIFLGFAVLMQAFTIYNYHGLTQTIGDIVNVFSIFSMVLLPAVFVLSILVVLSSIVLAKRSGFGWRNFLGVILGISLCVATLFPNLLNDFLQSAAFVDVHNEQGVTAHIQMFVDAAVFTSLTYVECVLISATVVTIIAARRVPAFDKDYVIILGCYVNPDGTPGRLLKARVDRAMEFAEMQKLNGGGEVVFLPSGGKGADEPISEAEAMKKYLAGCGVDVRRVLEEDKSVNTAENMKYSSEIIKKQKKRARVAFATTSYHVFRAGILATKLGLHYEGIGAKTRTYFWINEFVREFVAEMVIEKWRHALMVTYLWVMAGCAIGLMYLAAIL